MQDTGITRLHRVGRSIAREPKQSYRRLWSIRRGSERGSSKTDGRSAAVLVGEPKVVLQCSILRRWKVQSELRPEPP